MSGYNNGSVILIMQWCRVKEFNNVPQLTNSMYATRLLINPDIAVAREFASKLQPTEFRVPCNATLSSPLLSPVDAEDPFVDVPVVPIDELYGAIDNGVHCVIARVLKVDTDKGWFYESCKKCAKKVTPDGSGYSCEKCEMFVSSCQIRFIFYFLIQYII